MGISHSESVRVEGVFTLEGGSDVAGEPEAGVDPGADSSAVVGAPTLIRPERTTGLKHTRGHGVHNDRCSELHKPWDKVIFSRVCCVLQNIQFTCG